MNWRVWILTCRKSCVEKRPRKVTSSFSRECIRRMGFYCQNEKDREMTQMRDIRSMTFPELQEVVEQMGEKSFKAGQIFDWLHKKTVSGYDRMTNVSKALREKLAGEYPLYELETVQVQTSKIDGTKKFLFRLQDGHVIESVWMQYQHGNSVCISSQVGCRMGCRFCASTIGGLTRNLTAAEMLLQIYRIQNLTKERVSNVVVMGTGSLLTITGNC